MVSKYPLVTGWSSAVGASPMLFTSSPSTWTDQFPSPWARESRSTAATDATPGRACTASTRVSKNVTISSGSAYSPSGKLTAMVRTSSVRNPGSVCSSFVRLCNITPAPTTRMTERATSKVTNTRRVTPPLREPERVPPPSLR